MSRTKQMPKGKFTTPPKFRRGQYVVPLVPWRVLVPKDKDTGDVVFSVPGTTWTVMAPEDVLRPATPDELRAAGLTARLGDVEEMA